jgi:hypothetical protein
MKGVEHFLRKTHNQGQGEDPRWLLEFESRKPKLCDSKNLPEMMGPPLGNFDCF